MVRRGRGAGEIQQQLYGLRLKGVENTWKSEGSEKEKNGFRAWSVEIGTVPISTRNKRNPYYSVTELMTLKK
ncbi:hypothetical protein DESA109040_15165 [Deinococcus saxicola]